MPPSPLAKRRPWRRPTSRQQLDVARRQGQDLVASAQQVASRIQAEAHEQSQRDRQAAAERARQEIQQERDRAIAELRAEFADLTVSAAGRVIGESLNAESHRRIIEETLAESQFSGN